MKPSRGATLSLLASVALSACSAGGGSDTPTQVPDTAADRQALVTQSANIIAGGVISFNVASTDLLAATLKVAEAYEANESPSALIDDAQIAWRTAMSHWQFIEMLQVGPAGQSTMVIGGQDMRDEIYSWPTTSACKVDQITASQSYESASFTTENVVNAYGLDALEYLLFHDGADNQCATSIYPNAPQDDAQGNPRDVWSDLSADEIAKRRAQYAVVVAAALSTSAKALVDAWAASSDSGFYANFTTAGQEGSDFESNQEAINQLFAALFYLDLDTKDMKLAEPAGISPDCPTSTCPDDVESRWSRNSGDHIVQNLAALEAVYYGIDGFGVDGSGFDDLLRAMDAVELADTLGAAIVDAKAAAGAMPSDLADAVNNDTAKVQATYDAIKAVTDLLKSQFVTTLNLSIPDEGAGDND